MVAMDRKMGLFESVRACPKSPFVFSIYSCGVGFYILQQVSFSFIFFIKCFIILVFYNTFNLPRRRSLHVMSSFT